MTSKAVQSPLISVLATCIPLKEDEQVSITQVGITESKGCFATVMTIRERK